MNDPWYISEWSILLRLLLAMLMGGLIGLERERSNHAAGFRTHILVCLGSSLIMILSVYGFGDFVNEVNVRMDPARLAAAVITGVGFLGAGTILFTGKSITGLTTAASIWVVAAIGLAVGAGFYFAAVISTLLVLLNLWVFNKVERRYLKTNKQHLITLSGDSSPNLIEKISAFMEAEKIIIRKMTVSDLEVGPPGYRSELNLHVEVSLHVLVPNNFSTVDLVTKLQSCHQFRSISVE
ncbi:MgtC/SapB family protein [Paenibacillus urinalis]|uniref:MgtC/SapB family protein n=1 Tax=Paenibacillus urinalis TaxID=521520 RepID=A0AAX3MYX2_9BACL|nr:MULTISPECIES: MgtC/SapB family protein [Paenibacillus]WDH82009.1 MgtC/SapB family protein [Paenibacillus urinalis]WDH98056.1 MgtC/SapB family protein [Paenibacillus urinalis]WDI01738.1 MgtC/SapB family protein [Paenibacillus urinalis]GAK42737.1 putative transporter [Paenibacillus sp. TCA20]